MISNNIFVRADSTAGDRNGIDWFNAYETLQDALDYAMIQSDNTNNNIYCDNDIYTFNSLTINNDSLNIYGGNVIEDETLIISGFSETNLTSNFKTTILMYSDIYGYSGIFSSTGVNYISMYSGITYNGEEYSDIRMSNVKLSIHDGIYTSGDVFFEGVDARLHTLLPTDMYGFAAMPSGAFNYSSPITGTCFLHTYKKDSSVINSNIHGFYNGIVFDGNYDTKCIIEGVTIRKSSKAIVYNGSVSYISGVLDVKDTLIYDSDVGLYVKDVGTSGYLTTTINYSTFDTPYSLAISPLISGTIDISNCIMSGNIDYASGLMSINASYTLFDTLPSGYIFIPGTGIIYGDPVFIDTTRGDYSVGIAYESNSISSPALNAGYVLNDKLSVDSDLKGFKLSNSKAEGQDSFLYKNGNTIVWSDHMKEIRMAEFSSYNPGISYNYSYTTTVPIYNKITQPSFSRIDSNNDWTYDWDVVNFTGPGIENETKIVPKSVVDITDIINDPKYGIIKSNIGVKAYKFRDKRGISFDYDLSNRVSKIIWSLDGDHILTKTDMWKGEVIASYPLLPPPHPTNEKIFIKLDGIISVGENKYAVENNIETIIESVNDDKTFEWFSPDKDRKWDLKGILAHKGLLYITASWADQSSTTPYLLVYPSKGYHEDYQNVTPLKLELHPDNNDPRGITVYEDGSILISNYNVTEEDSVKSVKIFHYKPCFDYALKTNRRSDTKLILREAYDEVTLTQAAEAAD